MSARSSARLRTGKSDEIKETDAAPIAPASSARRATRKRDADDEPQQAEDATPAAAAAASASSVPDAKRPRRSSRTRSSASAAAAENKEEEEEEADREETKGPHAAEDDEDSAAEDEEQQGASDEEDADAAMADASLSSLDSLRVAAVGHLFSAATVAGRPALTLHSVARVCDFLTAVDIALRIAPTARASYATAAEYAQIVAQSAATALAAQATPAASKKQSSRKRGGGGRAAAAVVAAEPFSSAPTIAGNSVGGRSEVSVFTSARALTLLCSSRLRSIVAGIHTRSAKKKEEVFPLDARLLNRISEAIPTLQSLQCQLTSTSVESAFEFPVGLRQLNLSLMFFKARYVAVAKRQSRFTKLAKSWSTEQCDAFAEWTVGKAAALPSLTTLTLSTCAPPQHSQSWGSKSVASPKPSWIEPLASTPSLQHFTCDLGPARTYLESTADWPTALKRLVQLATFSGTMVQEHFTAILRDLSRFKRLQRLPLEDVQLTPPLLDSLKGLSRSLIDLRPHSLANVTNLSFLHDFTRLRRLDLFEQAPRPWFSYYPPTSTYTAGATAPTAKHIVETIESLSATRRAQIESIGVGSDLWTNELLLRLLTALPGLTELELRSKAVTSLAVLSAVAALRSSLKVLRLQTPSVPRADVTQLHSLLQLESLSIAGSFKEPLYARQLFPFLSPYPKQPLHWLRAFVPRSAKEPVPTPPVDLVARAAAYADFDARVRAGGVCTAELLNSAQLSCVMQFLDLKAFSIAARSCRSWRSAACLLSAWGVSDRVAAESGEEEPAAAQFGAGMWSPPFFGSISPYREQLLPPSLGQYPLMPNRALALSSAEPQCRPGVLQCLPLWNNAKSVVLASGTAARRAYSSSYYGAAESQEDLEANRQALLAIGQLPRLQALATSVSLRSADASPGMMQLFSRLRYLEARGGLSLGPVAFAHLGALLELRISSGSIGGEISALHQLRRLSLTDCWFNHKIGIALRLLSRNHALRELSVVQSKGDGLSTLLQVLAGQSVAAPAAVGSASADIVPPSAPALLECLRIAQRSRFSMSSVLLLPRLRCFKFWSWLSDYVELSPLETLVQDGNSFPPIEVLLLSTRTHGQLAFVEQLTSLRELRLSDGQSERFDYSQAPVSEHFNQRWARKLTSLKRLEIIVLNGVQIDPIDVATLDQLPKLRALTLNRQQSLRVCDLALLPRIRGLTELQLFDNPLLLLQKRDWMKDNGRQLPGESAIAAVETGPDAAAQSMQDVEEQKADTGAEQAPAAAAAAASSSVPALPADADGMLPLLLQCRSLRLLCWSSPATHFTDAERYTSRHSWVRPASSMRTWQLQEHRWLKEVARERQALRTLFAVNPELSIEFGADRHRSFYSPISTRAIALPPRSGSIVETEVVAAAERARKLKSSYECNNAVSNNSSLQAYEDRALLAIEHEEELEWRADAERKAAAKPKRRNKY